MPPSLTWAGLVLDTLSTASLTSSGFDSAISFSFCNTSIISMAYFLFGSGCGFDAFDRGLGVPCSSLLCTSCVLLSLPTSMLSAWASLSFNNSLSRLMLALVLCKSSAFTLGASLYSMSCSLFMYSDLICMSAWYCSVGSPGFLTTMCVAGILIISERYSFISLLV